MRLAYARRAEEEEGTDRPVWVGEKGARAPESARYCGDGFLLPDYYRTEVLFHVEEFRGGRRIHFLDGHAAHGRDGFGHVSLRGDDSLFGVFGLPGFEGLVELCGE